MDALAIEGARQELYGILNGSGSKRDKLIALTEYYSALLSSKSKNLIDAYSIEFIEEYVFYYSAFSPLFISPDITTKITDVSGLISRLELPPEYTSKLLDLTAKKAKEAALLKNYLQGKEYTSEKKIFFPSIESTGKGRFGYIDSISVKTHPNRHQDKHILFPTDNMPDKKLEAQINISWHAALEYIKSHNISIKGYHLNYIFFNKHDTYYSGDSLGAALFIAFVEALTDYYNLPVTVNIKSSIAVTGGVNEAGRIMPVSDKVIEEKTTAVFYSGIKYFVISPKDEPAASKRLEELKREYPGRGLSLTAIDDAAELLNRRNLIDIHRQPAIKRGIKFIKKNAAAAATAAVIISALLLYNFLMFDDNPATFDMKGDLLHIRNAAGDILWSKKLNFNYSQERHRILLESCKIIDIDNDNSNEVFVTREGGTSETMNGNVSRVSCYNYRGELIWEYYFRDNVFTKTIEHSKNYEIGIVDTVTINNQLKLLLKAQNVPYYPCALFFLNPLTGGRVDTINTLWHAGAITAALVGDFDKNGRTEVAATGVNNGISRAIFFSVDIDNLKGQLPSTNYYTFSDLKQTTFNHYVILPQTDYSVYYKNRYNCGLYLHSYYDELEVTVAENGITPNLPGGTIYRFTKDFKLKFVDCQDDLTFNRDDLIRKGKLKGPYTNTYEFFDELKSRVVYLKPGQTYTKELWN